MQLIPGWLFQSLLSGPMPEICLHWWMRPLNVSETRATQGHLNPPLERNILYTTQFAKSPTIKKNVLHHSPGDG